MNRLSRRSKLALSLAAFAIVLMLVAAVIAWQGISPAQREVTDPAEYSNIIRSFPALLAGHLPASIPHEATGTSLRYRESGGLGPSLLWLDVSFLIPPESAARLMTESRSRVMGPDQNTVSSRSNETIEINRGDNISTLRIDPTTGLVEIRVVRN